MRFTVLLSKSPNGEGYWAMVPAFPGCFSAGDTFEGTLENVKDAITLHAQGVLEEGDDLPEEGDFVAAHADVDLKTTV